MSIARTQLLTLGAHMRMTMMESYRQGGRETGCEIARQYIYELGQVMSDMHGRREAAAILYSVADAVTAELPIENYLLPTVPAPIHRETNVRRWFRALESWQLWMGTNCFFFALGVLAHAWWGSRP